MKDDISTEAAEALWIAKFGYEQVKLETLLNDPFWYGIRNQLVRRLENNRNNPDWNKHMFWIKEPR